MPGFLSIPDSLPDATELLFANNADFTGSANASNANGILTNGQLWIGSTAANAGGTHINVGTITGGAGVTIGYSSPNITISLAGGGAGIDSIAVQTGTSPVVPDGAGLITMSGSRVAAGTNPLRTNGSAPNTLTIEVQDTQTVAAIDTTRLGLANFDSSSFTVSSGFVTLLTTAVGKTITGDTGGPLSPTANNWNVVGGPGVTTSGTGSTLTINSTVFTDTTAATLVQDNGYFATAAGTYPLPATASQGELITVVCDTAGAVVLDAPALNFIRVGSAITAASGTATSNAIGDSLTLRYRLATLTWEATSVIGTWTLA